MKNRLSKLSRNACYMMLLLAVSGISTSCKDEYALDDEKPSWLSQSIYDKLKENGNYTNYLRLIADPDVNPTNARPLTEVLSRTGSKTVFAADDDAWNKFYADNALLPEGNPWHYATSYDKLSVSQKKLLIHTSMLNNAIVMENLSSSSSDISSRGDFMRRYTDVETTDTITFVDGDSLPVNYNLDNDEADYWWRFRKKNGGKGIYMVCDSTPYMMVHFTAEHLNKNSVTDDDFAKFMGQPRSTSDVHINDARLIDKDEVAENGYLNKTDKVLIPLPNMAELLRTNGKTKIFSHMLDRWSAPYYNDLVTRTYKNIMASRGLEWTDSIFSKRYFSTYSYSNKALNTDPKGQPLKGSDVGILKFDPGWNALVSNDNYWSSRQSTAPQYDMAAMFVPDDETLWEYFTENGGGWQLIKTYYLKEGTDAAIPYVAPTTLDELFQQIDQIPLGTLQSLIDVNMQRSFVGSVPSKLTKLRNDAQEQMFFPEDVNHITETMLANNGVIYITDKVYGPTDYTAVTAPAYISKTNLVMKYAIYNGMGYKDGKDKFKHSDMMGLNYYAYLKAMQSDFALFMPSDTAMYYYYDPVSFKSQKSRILHLYYKEATFPIKYNIYSYDPQKGEIGETFMTGRKKETIDDSEIVNRLKDILESHTIVLDGVKEINSGIDEYYLAKNGAALKVSRANDEKGNPHVVKVQGGFQIENEEKGITGSISADNKNQYLGILGIQSNAVTDEHNMENGTTYILSSPMIPASRSVYSIFTNEQRYDSPEFNDFYELCQTRERVIRACGLVDESGKLSTTQQQTEVKKYSIFVEDNGLDQNVQFFNNYRYTVFVPTPEALREAYAKGLPTWEEIEADYEDMKPILEESKTLRQSIKDAYTARDTATAERLTERLNAILPTAKADSLILQAKCTYLINFVRYHFADNSIFVDKSTVPSTDFVTASYDNEKGLFCKVNVRRPSSDVLEVQDYSETDANGNSIAPWVTVEGKHNIMARDYSCSSKPNGASMKGISITGSSFAVIHQIPAVLNHTELVNGRHDSQWSTAAAAKKYLKRFAIR